MFIRQDKVGHLLRLQCALGGVKGKIALGWVRCEDPWHIAIKTDNFQHPGCIDFTLTEGREFERGNADPTKYSATYTVKGSSGTFHVLLRWASGHSPYPEIETMEAWVFGVYLGSQAYPKALDGYRDIATVVVDAEGRVTVNGQNAGIWLELVEEE